MKVLRFYLMPIALAGFSSCKSGIQSGSAGPLIGKLVISEICSHLVVSVESGKINQDKLTANFRDEKRATSFQNVFTIENSCSFEKYAIKEGDRFYFEMIPKTVREECMVCLAYYPTPDSKLSITKIKKINQ